jgi:hypothetical protein
VTRHVRRRPEIPRTGSHLAAREGTGASASMQLLPVATKACEPALLFVTLPVAFCTRGRPGGRREDYVEAKHLAFRGRQECAPSARIWPGRSGQTQSQSKPPTNVAEERKALCRTWPASGMLVHGMPLLQGSHRAHQRRTLAHCTRPGDSM